MLRRLKRELRIGLAFLADTHDPRSVGQREALQHVVTVLRNLEAECC